LTWPALRRLAVDAGNWKAEMVPTIDRLDFLDSEHDVRDDTIDNDFVPSHGLPKITG